MDVALGDDRTIVRGFVESNLTAADLEGGLVLPDRRAAIEPLLADLVDRYGYRDIALVPSRKDDALDATSEGRSGVAIDARTIDALSRGSADIWVVPGEGGAHSSTSLIEAIPVVQGVDVRLVFQIRRDATPIMARAGAALRDVVVVTTSVVPPVIPRSGQARHAGTSPSGRVRAPLPLPSLDRASTPALDIAYAVSAVDKSGRVAAGSGLIVARGRSF